MLVNDNTRECWRMDAGDEIELLAATGDYRPWRPPRPVCGNTVFSVGVVSLSVCLSVSLFICFSRRVVSKILVFSLLLAVFLLLGFFNAVERREATGIA